MKDLNANEEMNLESILASTAEKVTEVKTDENDSEDDALLAWLRSVGYARFYIKFKDAGYTMDKLAQNRMMNVNDFKFLSSNKVKYSDKVNVMNRVNELIKSESQQNKYENESKEQIPEMKKIDVKSKRLKKISSGICLYCKS